MPVLTGQTSQRMESRRVYCEPFVLIAAMNPCPCGYFGDPVREWTQLSLVVSHYQKRSSDLLLDRIDINVEVIQVEYERLLDHRQGQWREASLFAPWGEVW